MAEKNKPGPKAKTEKRQYNRKAVATVKTARKPGRKAAFKPTNKDVMELGMVMGFISRPEIQKQFQNEFPEANFSRTAQVLSSLLNLNK